jgi:hypothetical protein
MTDQDDKRFVAYEYTTVSIRSDHESLHRDAYSSFGWVTEKVDRPAGSIHTVRLHLKRDRRIPNKAALAKLQRRFENAVEAIGHLERSKTSKAFAVAFTIGLVGSAALAGSVFCWLAAAWVPSILLGMVGLAGWALPYFVFARVTARWTEAVTPDIDQQYEAIYSICEQADALTAATQVLRRRDLA